MEFTYQYYGNRSLVLCDKRSTIDVAHTVDVLTDTVAASITERLFKNPKAWSSKEAVHRLICHELSSTDHELPIPIFTIGIAAVSGAVMGFLLGWFVAG